MKKFIVFPIIVLFLGNLYAQKKVSGGLFITPGVSWLKPQNVKEAENSGVGFNYKIGAGIDVSAVENFAICFGIQYATYNGKVSYKNKILGFETTDETYDTISNAIINYKLSYVEVPFSFKGKYTSDHITYFLKAGAHLGIRVAPKADIKGDTSNVAFEVTDAIVKKEVSFMNAGYHIGGGIEYAFDKSDGVRVVVEVLFNGGIWSIVETEMIKAGKSDITPKIYTNDVGLKIGLLF